MNGLTSMKSAVAKYGRPKLFNFDNGSSYKNKQMELLAARIGSALNYCRPYTPTAKAKIERWFRTMKDQWMASLDIRNFHSLDELRGNLFAWVHLYNNTPHASLNGKTPQERFYSEPEQIRRLPQEQLDKDFLLEIERRVSSDSVIVIDQMEYEVDFRFAKQRIRLRYSPDMKDIFIVEPDNSLTPIRLLNKQENAVSKEKKYIYAEVKNNGLSTKTTAIRNWTKTLNPSLYKGFIPVFPPLRSAIFTETLPWNWVPPPLNNTLRLTIHEPLRQCIVMNYNLEGMTKEEGRTYIQTKLKGAGCTQTVFEDAAIEAVLNAADGTPRVINKLCNASLLIGNSSNLNIINTNAVMQAINDCELG